MAILGQTTRIIKVPMDPQHYIVNSLGVVKNPRAWRHSVSFSGRPLRHPIEVVLVILDKTFRTQSEGHPVTEKMSKRRLDYMSLVAVGGRQRNRRVPSPYGATYITLLYEVNPATFERKWQFLKYSLSSCTAMFDWTRDYTHRKLET